MRDYMADMFEVQLPDDWEDLTSYTFLGPFTEHGHPLINILVQEAGRQSVKKIMKHQISAFEESFDAFQLLWEDVLEVSDCPAVEFAFVYKDHSGKQFYQRRLITIRDKRMFILIGNAPETLRQTLEPQFEAVFQSFQFHQEG